MASIKSLNKTGQYFFLSWFSLTFIDIYTGLQDNGEDLLFPPIQTFSYRDVYHLFLIDLFVITRLTVDEIYPPSRFSFNYILIDATYSKCQVLEFGVASNRQSVDLNPCIKNKTMNLQSYYETKKIKTMKVLIDR